MPSLFRRTRADEDLVIPAPAVSTDLDYAFDTSDMQINTRLKLKNVYFVFDADANAANRMINVIIQDHLARPIWRVSHETPVTANLFGYVNLAFGGNYKDWDGVSNTINLILPDLYVKDNYHLVIDIVADQAGDQISDTMVRYDRYEGVLYE